MTINIPCAWDVTCEACPDFEDWEDSTRSSALWLASTFLWAATGRRFGPCPVTVRPSQGRTGCAGDPVAYRDFPSTGQDGLGVTGGPFLFGGRWFNAGCSSACCGQSACAIVLRGPVAAIDEVIVGDEVVPSSAYRVDLAGGAYLLVRTDGECWPSCSGAPGDFEVTYDLGVPIPEALAVATSLLACEYGKFLTAGACRLPSSMTRLSRQGVEVEVAPADPEQGLTGIREIDSVIWALNPGRLQGPPVVLSLDLPEACDRVTVIGAGS